eukprot:c10092_g1_i1 orf=85-390(+)
MHPHHPAASDKCEARWLFIGPACGIKWCLISECDVVFSGVWNCLSRTMAATANVSKGFSKRTIHSASEDSMAQHACPVWVKLVMHPHKGVPQSSVKRKHRL